jgi:hypothetical protein
MCRSGAEFLCPRHGGFLQTVADYVDSVFPADEAASHSQKSTLRNMPFKARR